MICQSFPLAKYCTSGKYLPKFSSPKSFLLEFAKVFPRQNFALYGTYVVHSRCYFVQIVYLKAYANHLKGVQVMATISLQCNSLAFSNTFKCLLQAENSMTGRAYMGEVLIQVWLRNE